MWSSIFYLLSLLSITTKLLEELSKFVVTRFSTYSRLDSSKPGFCPLNAPVQSNCSCFLVDNSVDISQAFYDFLAWPHNTDGHTRHLGTVFLWRLQEHFPGGLGLLLIAPPSVLYARCSFPACPLSVSTPRALVQPLPFSLPSSLASVIQPSTL